LKKKTQNKINYLDITITKEDNKLSFVIYRKPTTTDSITYIVIPAILMNTKNQLKLFNKSDKHLSPHTYKERSRTNNRKRNAKEKWIPTVNYTS
jgi:hypothetical protein